MKVEAAYRLATTDTGVAPQANSTAHSIHSLFRDEDLFGFHWDAELATGNKQIDADHQHLIGLTNHLGEAISQGKGLEAVEPTFDALLEYISFHFAREEQLMRAIHYAGVAEHKEAHDNLVRDAPDMIKRFRSNAATLPTLVYAFLVSWLKHHLWEMDKKLSDAIRQSGQSAQPDPADGSERPAQMLHQQTAAGDAAPHQQPQQ